MVLSRAGRRGIILALAILAIGGLCVGIFTDPAPRLVWNASASAPIGLYRVQLGIRIDQGDLVLAGLPDIPRILAAERGYLPDGVPLIKRVAGKAGDWVCGDSDTVMINGHAVASRIARDSENRSLPRWTDCRVLAESEVFLLMADVPDSFDSRYFGPIQIEQIIGRLVPLWTE